MMARWIGAAGLLFFFFNDPATTEIYPLSLPDALPISIRERIEAYDGEGCAFGGAFKLANGDRKSTRLNSSNGSISYAVFCLYRTTYRISDITAFTTHLHLSTCINNSLN